MSPEETTLLLATAGQWIQERLEDLGDEGQREIGILPWGEPYIHDPQATKAGAQYRKDIGEALDQLLGVRGISWNYSAWRWDDGTIQVGVGIDPDEPHELCVANFIEPDADKISLVQLPLTYAEHRKKWQEVIDRLDDTEALYELAYKWFPMLRWLAPGLEVQAYSGFIMIAIMPENYDQNDPTTWPDYEDENED